MAEVRLHIANRDYIVTCRDGEEERLLELGAMVDKKAQEAGGNATGLNESRLLLFAALLLADESSTSQNTEKEENDSQSNNFDREYFEQEAEMAADAIDKLTDRIENLALSLEQSIK